MKRKSFFKSLVGLAVAPPALANLPKTQESSQHFVRRHYPNATRVGHIYRKSLGGGEYLSIVSEALSNNPKELTRHIPCTDNHDLDNKIAWDEAKKNIQNETHPQIPH